MTTMDTTAPTPVTFRNRQPGAASNPPRRGAIALAAVALAASLTGGIVGAAAAVTLPGLTRDHAAEQAKWVAFADQFERALAYDDLWQQMHPER